MIELVRCGRRRRLARLESSRHKSMALFTAIKIFGRSVSVLPPGNKRPAWHALHFLFVATPGERGSTSRELAQVEARIETSDARRGSGGLVDKEFGETRSGAQDLGDAGPVLDSQALNAYKRRYDELGSELQEAETPNNVGRVARLRSEREALGLQLRSALTLHGRVRTAGAHGERARSAVCKSIRFSMKRIAKFTRPSAVFSTRAYIPGYELRVLPKNPFTWVF